MNRFAQLALVVCASIGLAQLAAAEPVAYDESVSGDLDANHPITFVLDAGVNSISGTTGFYVQPGPVGYLDDRDSFFVQVNEDIFITSASLTLSRHYGHLEFFEWLVVKDGDWSLPQSIRVPAEGVQSLSLDLSPGLYYFHHGSMGGNIGSEDAYRFEFNASSADQAISEPTTLVLLVAAWMSMAYARRRDWSARQLTVL